MASNRFYLACLRDTTGTNVAFHGDPSGYHTDIDKAREYTLEQAQRAWNAGREFDLPLCADRVDALATWHVDCQYIPHKSTIVENCNRYVAFQKGRWDGNDVFWIRTDGAPTTDFSMAGVYDTPGDEDGAVWIPFELADAVKRRTVSISNINRRKMVQGAGLIMPEHVKRHRNRRDSGKTRWNCPGCGKINWQYNPHDFQGCKDAFCPKAR